MTIHRVSSGEMTWWIADFEDKYPEFPVLYAEDGNPCKDLDVLARYGPDAVLDWDEYNELRYIVEGRDR